MYISLEDRNIRVARRVVSWTELQPVCDLLLSMELLISSIETVKTLSRPSHPVLNDARTRLHDICVIHSAVVGFSHTDRESLRAVRRPLYLVCTAKYEREHGQKQKRDDPSQRRRKEKTLGGMVCAGRFPPAPKLNLYHSPRPTSAPRPRQDLPPSQQPSITTQLHRIDTSEAFSYTLTTNTANMVRFSPIWRS